MYGERHDASDGDVASWLERVGARLRELEAENARLKQELANLRRGAGIALMIEGRVVPLALQTPAEQPPVRQPHASQPAALLPPGLAPHTGPVPTPTPAAPPARGRAALATFGPFAHSEAPASRQSFGPLAATPDELPAVRGLVPASHRPTRGWQDSDAAWPEVTPSARRGHQAATLRTAIAPTRGTYPPARPTAVSDPLWRERPHGNELSSPYADSFIL